jgi:Xaa-Pro aminopeptidase
MGQFDEPRRWAELLAAQDKAAQLFEAAQALIAPGLTESELSQAIFEPAAERFGVEAHWHKAIVRAGANTLATYHQDTQERVLEADDILFVDLGPVFDDWEADFGATFVLGDDPVKHKLNRDLALVFAELAAHYAASPNITGAELYAQAHRAAERRGWRFGGTTAGHLVGEFPHTDFPGERAVSLIAPVNTTRMRDRDADGRERYWILEVHLVEPEGRFGGFCEELLGG